MTENLPSFYPSESQEDLRELVKSIVAKFSTDDRVAALDSDPDAWDQELYTALVEAGVVAAIIGDEEDPGMGNTGLMHVLIEAGRGLARTPLASTCVAGMALHTAGRRDDVDAIVDGDMTVALALPDQLHDIRVIDGRVQGSIGLVHGGKNVTHLLVAETDGAVRLMPAYWTGIEKTGTGFSYVDNVAVSIDMPTSETLLLSGVNRRFVEQRWRIALAAFVVGVCQEAVARTATYTSERTQFGATLSAKQAVLLQAADAHIDTECIYLTTLDAAGRLDASDKTADVAVAVAAWWANEAGFRVVHATQHLHGGIGADTDNHIHRFFVFVREAGLVLGASDSLLEHIGFSVIEHANSTAEVELVNT